MAEIESLIDFDIIENQKENIAALPSGRSAKSLAQIYSPVLGVTSPAQTQDINASTRQEYENEIKQIDDSDDPLDVYDRYIKWTLNAYPSASATPQSQLLPLLERATKTFLKSDQYRNDPRYLKFWLQYIRLFSDAPRETFCFLARNHIGASLALYYEEYAAWLENAGRWKQAEQIYDMGIEKEARPLERLVRKFGEFKTRAASRPDDQQGPSSPALPTVRPVLAAKVDPFAMASPPPNDPQAAARAPSSSAGRKPKLQIFADDGQSDRPSTNEAAIGWTNVGTLAERRKENVRAPQPWTGEGLGTGTGVAPNIGIPKMAIFQDKSVFRQSLNQVAPYHPALDQRAVNQRNGRTECVFVNLEAIYPNPNDPSEEYCFEELRAAARGWLKRDWSVESANDLGKRPRKAENAMSDTTTTLVPLARGDEPSNNAKNTENPSGVNFNDENNPDARQACNETNLARRLRREERANRTRKIKVREIRSETQTIQTNLDSPRGPKLKRKKSTEPTMTVQTRAAMEEIYEIFNETLDVTKEAEEEEEEEGDEESDLESDEDSFTSTGESTGTGRISGGTSECGEETQGELTEVGDETHTATGTATGEMTEDNTGWSEFTAHKHMPAQDDDNESGILTSTGQPEPSNDLTGGLEEAVVTNGEDPPEEEAITPTSPELIPLRPATFCIPIPPEGYDAPTGPYRDPAQAAANRLPFMTPIVEKTESSLGTATGHKDKDYFSSKTPCPKTAKGSSIQEFDDEIWSSPLQEVVRDIQLDRAPTSEAGSSEQQRIEKLDGIPIFGQICTKRRLENERIIRDARCNPMEQTIRDIILQESEPPVASLEGYFRHNQLNSNLRGEIKKFCKGVNASKSLKGAAEKSTATHATAPILRLDGSERSFTVKREIGAGAYGPVYLVEQTPLESQFDKDWKDTDTFRKSKFGAYRKPLEAMKMEEPPSPWEFFIIRAAHRRLGVSRAAESIVQAYEMHMFEEECFLIEEYEDQGTLLDLVNAINDQNHAAGGHSGVDEMLAMFFTVELLRTLESLHSKGIIHGDLKADNVLLRLSQSVGSFSSSLPIDDEQLQAQYKRDGSGGWSSKGITLIDFGRGIDMQAFKADVQFIADWQTSATDCAEMRELRPWTFQADYYGIAAIAHTLLFGKYIETVVERSGAAETFGEGAKAYKLKEGLKRYWQTELWNEFFMLLLNPLKFVGGEDNQRLPCTRSLQAIRAKMEAWLENNADKGLGLRAMIRRTAAIRKKN